MIVTRRTLLTVLLMLQPLMSANAQEDVLPEEQEIRRYTIEIIIFKYAQEVSTGSEVFPPDEPPRESLFDSNAGEDEAAAAAPEKGLPRRIRDIEYVPLNRNEFSMNDTARRLELLEVYDPVMHFGWTQATWPAEETLPIELSRFRGVPKGLEGRFTLYLSRYLHLVVDLALDAPDSDGRAGGPRSDYRDGRLGNDPGELRSPGAVHYRINENRILRSGELRYFDHPKFGVLAKASRVEDDGD